MKRPYKGSAGDQNKHPLPIKSGVINSLNKQPTKRIQLPVINKKQERPPIEIEEQYREQNYVDEALGNLFHEYFIINGYMKTLDCFQKEQGQASTKRQSQEFKRLLLESFDKGDKDSFFKVFNRYTPLHIRMKDDRTTKLEFYLNIYFLIYKVHPSNKVNGSKKKSTIDPETRQSFQKYLKSKGEALANTGEFLPYYALAYIQPFENPEFRQLFTEQWMEELREKVVNFVDCLYPHEKPLLSQIYQSHVQKSMKDTQSKQTSSLKDFGLVARKNEKIQELEKRNEDMQNYIQTLTGKYWEFQSNFRKFGQNTKNTLIESQRKWFQLTQEIFMMGSSALKIAKKRNGGQVSEDQQAELRRISDKIQKYQGFINTNIDDLISQDVDFSMFEKPSVSVEHQVQHQVQDTRNNVFICLDIKKIKDTFASQNTGEIVALLKALKHRIRTSQGVYLKRQVVVQLALFDIFGTRQEGQPLLKKLLFGNRAVSEEMGKLVSTFANDYYGRTYLFHAVGPLIKAMKEQKGDTLLRECLIVTFEFMSLRRKGQLSMINNGFVEWIVNVLKNERETLGEDKLGYLTALLMNLSFRKQGLDKCQQIRDQLMMNLIELFQHKNTDIQSYINGALYSVLSRKSFREKAKEHGLSDLIDYQINNGVSVDVTQLNYVKQMLNRQDEQHQELHDQTDYEDLQDGGDDLDDIDEQPLSANHFTSDPEDTEETNVERLLVESYTFAGPEIINHMKAISREVDESLKRKQASFIKNDVSQDRPSSMMRPLIRNRSNISNNRGGSASNRMLPSELRQRVRPHVEGEEQLGPVSPMSRESSLGNSQIPRQIRQVETHPEYKQVFLPRNQIVRTPPHNNM